MQAPDPILKNVQAIVELERQTFQQRTRLERVSDLITQTAGSGAFVVAHVAWFVAWVVSNLGPYAFDPYPFSLLNMLVSIEAIILTSLVLMTQNRMTHQADRRAHLDLQVNLLAEQELTAMLHMLHALCDKARVKVSVKDERVEQLLKETDIQQLASTLEKELAGDMVTPPS